MRRLTRRQRRRRRVIRNWICLILVVTAIVVLTVVIVSAFNNKDNEEPEDVPIPTTVAVANQEPESGTEVPVEGIPATEYEPATEEVVVLDVTPPDLIGSDYIYVSIGSTVKYKSYMYAEDDTDPDPKMTIDNSAVDLSRSGEYPVVYSAVDSAGNYSSRTATIVVSDQTEPSVDEATIYALADQVLDSIIDEDMTDLEKVFAVFFYVRDTFTYVKDNNYWEYKQEAYHMMTTLMDNCYANVCVSILLLERLGFKSYMVQGEMGYVDEYHYWNMVSIDDGETWYIYDAAFWEWMDDEYPMCMMTDDFAMRISDAHDNIVNYAADSYPPTPEEDLWTPEEMGFVSYYLD